MDPFEQMVHHVSSALFVAIFMLWIVPKFVWKKLAHVRGLSPNWMTLWGVPITWAGFILYFWFDSYSGLLTIVFGLVLDRIDGKMAKLNPSYVRIGLPPITLRDHWRWFRRELDQPGGTETGKWLDPLADKFKIPPFILLMAFMGYFSVSMAIGIILIAIVSTIMRPPFQLIPDRYLRGNAATGFGKLKVTAEFSSMILVLPLHQGWIQFPLWYLDVTLGATLILGILSTISRLRFKNEVANGVIDGVSEAFRHD